MGCIFWEYRKVIVDHMMEKLFGPPSTLEHKIKEKKMDSIELIDKLIQQRLESLPRAIEGKAPKSRLKEITAEIEHLREAKEALKEKSFPKVGMAEGPEDRRRREKQELMEFLGDLRASLSQKVIYDVDIKGSHHPHIDVLTEDLSYVKNGGSYSITIDYKVK